MKKEYEGEVDICSRDRVVRERGEAHYGSSYGEKKRMWKMKGKSVQLIVAKWI